jgi:AraC family transcriptional regulator
MKKAPVPVTMGSSWSRSLQLPLCSVTEAHFPAGALLPTHTHNRATFGVMLDGSFETRIGAHALACDRSTSWVEPREEKHENAIGKRGAWVVIVQPDNERPEFEPLLGFLDTIHLERSGEVVTQARRVAAEIARPDALTMLTVESAVLGMLASAARLSVIREHARVAPVWVRQARDLIHESFRSAPGLSEIASAVGVPPTQLAHAFRRYYGTSLGDYARELRFAWALERIISTTCPLARLALQAGFADQSHLNRECKARTGFTPLQLRQRRSNDVIDP